jgi:hypothetical protein
MTEIFQLSKQQRIVYSPTVPDRYIISTIRTRPRPLGEMKPTYPATSPELAPRGVNAGDSALSLQRGT